PAQHLRHPSPNLSCVRSNDAKPAEAWRWSQERPSNGPRMGPRLRRTGPNPSSSRCLFRFPFSFWLGRPFPNSIKLRKLPFIYRRPMHLSRHRTTSPTVRTVRVKRLELNYDAAKARLCRYLPKEATMWKLIA